MVPTEMATSPVSIVVLGQVSRYRNRRRPASDRARKLSLSQSFT
jgi:hypothetical protein